MAQVDLLIHSAAQLVTCAGERAAKRGAAMSSLGIVINGAVAVHNGLIVEVGETADLANRYTARSVIDASEQVVCPGFVDSHTHIVYAGDRAAEFEMRLRGASYLEIMAAGGGIVSTMRQVRAASVEQLVAETRARLDTMMQLGTTTVEIKTGYGLDLDTELKMLRVIEILAETSVVDIVPTFLGAHAIPPEYKDRADEFTQHIIDDMIPAVATWYRASHFALLNIPLFIDVFCEQNAFNLDQSRRILQAGLAHDMRVKAHVDEFTDLGGATMAVENNAVSIDHLDVTHAAEIERLAGSNTVAVVIPAVNFNLGSTHFADARTIIDSGAALALATDNNPGSAPCPSMPLVMAIACRYQKLLPAEALNASTINGAYAVGMGERVGSLEPGKQADLLILNAPDYRHLSYQFGASLVEQVIKRGKVVYSTI